jgi:hypothetical protein
MVAVAAFVCGAIAFVNARSTALSESEPKQWLSEASNSVVALDEKFNKELAGLIANLLGEQESLGSVLEDPCTPDEIVLERAENVITAHEQLMKRAGEHVVELRGKLPSASRQHLMGLCAETFRGPICRLEGRGGGRGMHDGTGGGMSNGMGLGRRGGGRGPGGGRGMRRGIRSRLANHLGLDERQVALLREEDADFEAETAGLRDVLVAERAELLSMVEDAGSTDDQLLRQIEKLMTAHSAIERRIVRHVLVLRPYLTVEQQKWLIGLCRRSQGES